jgi:hypothetical protein
MNPDGSDPVQLTNNTNDDNSPTWSPDGERIAFLSNRDGTLDLFVMNANGSNPINLTNDSAVDFSLDWSPDSRSLAFETDRSGSRDLFTLRLDDMLLTQVTDDPDDFEAAPSWSPDGYYLAYVAPNSTGDSGEALEIYAQDMTDLDSPPISLTSNAVLDSDPAWAPSLDSMWLWMIPFNPVPSALVCPQSPPSRLNTGMRAYVPLLSDESIRRSLKVRAEPVGEQVGTLEPGVEFLITGEPICGEDGLRWWPLSTLDGVLTGWSVEGFAPDDYLMIPYENE